MGVPEWLPRLPPPIELAVYRVVQEALANSLRHAAASRMSLAARQAGSEPSVWLIDDGRGFDPGMARARRPAMHLRLVSMAIARRPPAAVWRRVGARTWHHDLACDPVGPGVGIERRSPAVIV